MRLLCHRGATRGFAEAALALLRRKFERHHAGEDFEAFMAASGGEENPRTKRVEALHALFACPEGILVAQRIEEQAFDKDPAMGEAYGKCMEEVTSALRQEALREKLMSGEVPIDVEKIQGDGK